MKTRNISAVGKLLVTVFAPAALVLVGWNVAAQAQQAGTGPETAAPATASQAPATNSTPPAALSPGVGEILKLADAGVSVEVIKVYVDCSPTVYRLTEADVIALKQHGVGDDLVTRLLKRGAQDRVAVAIAKSNAVARAVAARTAASGGLDPEGYDYFQAYYLQPRAMASVYQRLYPYRYPAFACGPSFSDWTGRRHRFGFPPGW